jgi:hypothetical protein
MSDFDSFEEFDELPQYTQIKICKNILHCPDYNWQKKPLFGDDLDLMLHVFKKHPKSETKLNNIDRIEVRKSVKSRRYKNTSNYCFHLVYMDESSDDISYRKCLDKNHNKDKKGDGDIPRYLTMTRIKGLKGLRVVPKKVENLEMAILNETLPSTPAIYFLWENDCLIYVGRSVGLLQRMQCDDHKYINQPQNKYISYIDCKSYKETVNLEKKYIRKLIPIVPSLLNNCVVAKKVKRDLGLDK